MVLACLFCALCGDDICSVMMALVLGITWFDICLVRTIEPI